MKKSKKATDIQLPDFSKLPKDMQKKLANIKKKVDSFKTELLSKFGEYITGIALMPPPRPEQPQSDELAKAPEEKQEKPNLEANPEANPEDIYILVLVDDSDSKKMSKIELKQKLSTIVDETAKKVDAAIKPKTVILSELWQNCYDAKYEPLQMIAMSIPIHDNGMLAAIKLGEIHKTMVLKKFEKYIVSYVLSGSLTRGEATQQSDIDIVIVIDDTDVKKMTRAELKDKLRAIIIGMGIEAGEMTGIRNKLNVQVYILTEFWDSLKEANPVIFTLLRDGVPFFDRGMFMPWKQLLKMGRIKPSTEAIDMFMSAGEQMVSRVKARLKELVEADMYWATLTPTQAALMLYGVPPPTPKETIELMENIFVKKEKLLEPKYIEMLKEIRKYYKGIEHGDVKEISGTEIDSLLKKSEDYLKRIKTLFGEIETIKEKEGILKVYDTIVSVARDVLKTEAVEKVKDADIVKEFDEKMVETGKIPARYLRSLKEIIKAKDDYEANKLTKHEVEKVKKSSGELIRHLVEYVQRKRGREIERTRVRVKHGDIYGEIVLLDKTAFIIHNIDAEPKKISKAAIEESGGLGVLSDSNPEEFEAELAKAKIPQKVFIKNPIFEDLKRIFGGDVEVQVNLV